MKASENFINLSVGLISITLAIIAIWLSLHFKSESDETNLKTREILTEIKSDAKSMKYIVDSELSAWGNTARSLIVKSNEYKNLQIDNITTNPESNIKVIQNKKFENEPIYLDNHHFINRTFKNCDLIFSADGPVGLTGNRMIKVRLLYSGKAASTFNFISLWYSSLDEVEKSYFVKFLENPEVVVNNNTN